MVEITVNATLQETVQGEEVGYPEVNEVELYSITADDGEGVSRTIYFYYDAESKNVLQIWTEDETVEEDEEF